LFLAIIGLVKRAGSSEGQPCHTLITLNSKPVEPPRPGVLVVARAPRRCSVVRKVRGGRVIGILATTVFAIMQ
jgi:hypothetical protein